MRWLYFLGGLGGCVMIATGMLFWLRSRERKMDRNALGFRAVEALTIGSVTGIILATGAFLIANCLLPEDVSSGGVGRADVEVRMFFAVWIAALVHAAIVRHRAWAHQCWGIAALAILAAILNWATSDAVPVVELFNGDTAVGAIDLALIVTATLAVRSAMHFRSAKHSALKPQALPAE